VCLGGMVEMQVTLWVHRLVFRWLAVFGVVGRSVGGSQVALRYMWLDGVLSGSWPHV